MADRVVLLAAPPAELMRGFSASPQMIEDLLVVAQTTRESIEAVATALQVVEGFLDDRRLEQVVQESIPDERAASAVARAILNIRPGRLGQIISSLREWREDSPQNAQQFSDDAFAAVQEKLPRLAQGYPALERFRKARRLQALTGNQAEDVDLVCDARPIYDEQRERIEGFVTVTTLRIAYETQAGESSVIEFMLSQELLHELLNQAQKGQQKLAVLRASINQWIPEGLADLVE